MSWLIAGDIPGIQRQPLKKIAPDETELLRVLHRSRDEAVRKGGVIARIAVFEAGRDAFWLVPGVIHTAVCAVQDGQEGAQVADEVWVSLLNWRPIRPFAAGLMICDRLEFVVIRGLQRR